MRLCLAFGCTLQELGNRMPAEEFGAWAALYAQEPFGDVRADLRAGMLAATLVNMAGKTLPKNAPAVVPTDFTPFLNAGAPEPEPAQEPDPVAFFSALGR